MARGILPLIAGRGKYGACGIIRRVDARPPVIDEHSVEVGASAESAWDAVGAVMGRDARSRPVTVVARMLGCRETAISGAPTDVGSTFPGFRVAEAARPSTLVFEGRHRFSTYSLAFRVDSLGPRRARVRAETRAAFPGAVGSAYRAMVIGTRGHVVAVRRMLRAIRQRAEATA